MTDLKTKLNPRRFAGMSPFMAAIIGYVLGESFTNPDIAEIMVSEAENLVYIRKSGAAGSEGIESLTDLRELTGTASSARLRPPCGRLS